MHCKFCCGFLILRYPIPTCAISQFGPGTRILPDFYRLSCLRTGMPRRTAASMPFWKPWLTIWHSCWKAVSQWRLVGLQKNHEKIWKTIFGCKVIHIPLATAHIGKPFSWHPWRSMDALQLSLLATLPVKVIGRGWERLMAFKRDLPASAYATSVMERNLDVRNFNKKCFFFQIYMFMLGATHCWSGMVECSGNWKGSIGWTSQPVPFQENSTFSTSLGTRGWITWCDQTRSDARVSHWHWRGSCSKHSVRALPLGCLWPWCFSGPIGQSVFQIWSVVLRSSSHFLCERIWKQDLQSESVPWIKLQRFVKPCWFAKNKTR